jgi:hypothetical protein
MVLHCKYFTLWLLVKQTQQDRGLFLHWGSKHTRFNGCYWCDPPLEQIKWTGIFGIKWEMVVMKLKFILFLF